MPQQMLPCALATSVLLIAGAAVVEAYRIQTRTLEISFDRLPAAFDGFSILHLTDLHTAKHGLLEKRLSRMLEGLSADLLCATGDLAVEVPGVEPLCRILSEVETRAGKFAVFGNSENGQAHVGQRVSETLPACGIKLLRNANTRIARGGASIVIAGVDDPYTRHADLEAALQGVTPDDFIVLLAHSPQIANEAVRHGVDLVLCGHTHGGQFRLPFIPAPYAHLGGGPRLVSGMYEAEALARVLGRDPGRTRIYVSRGIGASYIPARLFCRPEVAVIILRRSNTGR